MGGLIGKATLTKDGLLGARGFQPRGRVSEANYSNKLEPGAYLLHGEIVTGINQMGQLIVIRCAYDQHSDNILHIVIPFWADAIYYRFINGLDYTNYTPWIRIDGVRTEIEWTPT